MQEIETLPFIDKLNELFYEGMDRKTSVYLFGSAATGNWVAGRSDIDLVVLVPREKLELLGAKIRLWASTPALPILDGFAISFSGRRHETTQLEQFKRVTYPSSMSVGLIDQWNIQNRSIHLFGEDSVNRFFPAISQSELKDWAIGYLKNLLQSNPEGNVPETIVLSELVWPVSWAARMLLLSRGHICESKQEALRWLASECPEIRDSVGALLDEYANSNKATTSISSDQSVILRRFCLQLLSQEININPVKPFNTDSLD